MQYQDFVFGIQRRYYEHLTYVYIFLFDLKVIGSGLNWDKQARHSARGHDLLLSNGRLQGYVEVSSVLSKYNTYFTSETEYTIVEKILIHIKKWHEFLVQLIL
jgi:hypothetical protein